MKFFGLKDFHLRSPTKPVIHKRYVDETSLLFQNTDQVEKSKNYLNLQYAGIKFTFEIQMNNLLLFSDIKIVRENKKFTSSVFQTSIHWSFY